MTMTKYRERFQQKLGYVFTSIEEENQRLEELYALEILDSPAEEAFDRITETVAQTFQVPICLITLITEDREWIKSGFGIDNMLLKDSIPREKSFCQHIVAGKQTLVPDRVELKDFPFEFYVGAPLITENNHVLGTLCIADYNPRSFSEQEIAMLERLAQWTMSEIQLRSRLLAAKRREQFLKKFFSITSNEADETETKINKLLTLRMRTFRLFQWRGSHIGAGSGYY